MAKLTLTNPTDDELNVAFAVEIAGWRDVRYEEDEDVDIDSRTIYPWKGMAGWPPDGGKRRLIPCFTTFADAVLPWLEKTQWAIYPRFFPGWGKKGWDIRIYEHDESAPLMGESAEEGFGFAKAAVVALLRAHNVEVTFTEPTP